MEIFFFFFFFSHRRLIRLDAESCTDDYFLTRRYHRQNFSLFSFTRKLHLFLSNVLIDFYQIHSLNESKERIFIIL